MEINMIRKFNIICDYSELCLIRQSLSTYMKQMSHGNFEEEEAYNEVKAYIDEIDKILDKIR